MEYIFLIEPDKVIANLTAAYLSRAGYQIKNYKDLQQALLAADKDRPQALITEIQLAGRSGIELLYEFRSYPDWQDVPLIIYTNLQPDTLERFQTAMAEQHAVLLNKSADGLWRLKHQLDVVLQPAAA